MLCSEYARGSTRMSLSVENFTIAEVPVLMGSCSGSTKLLQVKVKYNVYNWHLENILLSSCPVDCRI